MGFFIPNVPERQTRCPTCRPAKCSVCPTRTRTARRTASSHKKIGGETVVYVVKNNRVVDVRGNSDEVEELRRKFSTDRGWQNIAEFAIGVNDKAKVTGIVLEDEKAGFHWAYGRSDHFGGQCGVTQFSSPEKRRTPGRRLR